ncbi:MAG: hypothetical protein PVJ02_00395 [Gemmatimonadota bacterium]|jgi:hypothetical protein
MNIIRRTAIAVLALTAVAPRILAQEQDTQAREAYFRAVAEFFSLPPSEVSIIGEWRLASDEIPVALFVAHRAGVSPEAVVALRRSGKSWSELARRFRLDASQFYVPIPAGASAGRLQDAYDRYRGVSADRWGEVSLADSDIVGLVNLRILAQTLRMPPETVLARAGNGSWALLYARLIRDNDGSRDRQERP